MLWRTPIDTDSRAKLGDLAASSGLRRIHLLAWRDLSDVEAGGSEVHAAEIARLWAEAGIEVTMRTSYAQGHPPDGMRDGYRVIRRAGRYLVFPRAALAEAAGRHGPRDGLVEIWNGMPFLSPLEYDPADFVAMLHPVLHEDARVVYGTRSFGSNAAFSFWYVMGNKLVAFWASLLYNAWLSDVETCLKLAPTELWRDIEFKASGFGIEAEVTGGLLRRGERIYEVPISYKARSREEGKKITWLDGVDALWILLRIRLLGR